MVANQASFDPRNYGYRKLSDLVRAIGLFEIKQDEQAVWVRDTPTGGRAKPAQPAAAKAQPVAAPKRPTRVPAQPAAGG